MKNKGTNRQYGDAERWESIRDALKNSPVVVKSPGRFPPTQKRLDAIKKG